MPVDDPSTFADQFRVASSRLKNWDYSTPGFYYVTICTLNHNKFFGKIENGKMVLSQMGLIAYQCLINIPKHFLNTKLGIFVIMPNHVHLVLKITNLLSNFVETPSQTSAYSSDLADKSTLRNLPVETPDLASLQHNQKITLINYCHKNHPDYYPRLNQKSKQLIPKIIQQYKSSVTRQINPKTRFFSWQPRFYDHLIKNQTEYHKIKQYVIANPTNWFKDPYHG